MPPTQHDVRTEHAALTSAAGVADFADRTQVELTGADRASFLHNFCTNAIRNLPPGGGCEAFITDAKGAVVAHVQVFIRPESIVLETVPGQAAKIMAHLDRYIIREKVELHDRSSDWAELLVGGPSAEAIVRSGLEPGIAEFPSQPGQNLEAVLFGHSVSLRRVQIAGPDNFLVSCERGAAGSLREKLVEAGAAVFGPDALEAARIEWGWPLYGRDIVDKTLPQELARDQCAISFTKGCYLGQETVARIDALGHVNKTLVGVRFHGTSVPAVGTELLADGKPVGNVTSAAWSPRLGAPLALAYVRRGHNAPGAKLMSSAGEAEVIALPVQAAG